LTILFALGAGLAKAQTPARPAEKVRVTYRGSAGCPDSIAFLEQVRARVGSAWEAPPNELARTIEVRVAGGGDRSVARIDFVDENNQPITRVVTAQTCDEVVTGIALVTALAIESRIAEAVGKSEPPTAVAGGPAASAAEPPKTQAPEASKAVVPPAVAEPVREPPEPPRAPPHYDIGGGVIASVGALPGISPGFRGFIGLGWSGGPDFRVGGEFSNTGNVNSTVNGNAYDSKFTLALGRASVCPIALGDKARFLPCGGLEIGQLKARGQSSTPATGLQVEGDTASALWVAPFVSVRGDVTWEIFFAEAEVSLAVPLSPVDRDFVIRRTVHGNPTRDVEDKVHTIWPVCPGVALNVGLRL
jgi:hypothetical protein